MAERVTIKEEKFLRPKKKTGEEGGERFEKVLRRMIRVAFKILILSFVIFIGHRFYLYLSEDPFFRTREIEVEGCKKVSKEELLALIRMEGMPNLFTLQLKEISRRLESHPWIKQVRIKKVFPHKIWIQVEERKPIAIVQLEEPYYIDAQGVIFSPVGDQDQYDYPFLTGLTHQALKQDASGTQSLIKKALEFLSLVEKEKRPPLKEISEIHLEKTFGLRCFSQSDHIWVRVGWEEFGEKLRRLSLVWSDLKRRGIPVISIDCNDLKRIVVKKSPPRRELERR
ncbi:MAG: cell division protein FtsQ/DivIB [Thermodesulfobacteriota bacterium]